MPVASREPTKGDLLSSYSPLVQSAIADPDGARVALLAYGELLGWPLGAIPPIPCQGGEESWRTNIERVSSPMLGMAWEGIERRARAARQAQEQDEELKAEARESAKGQRAAAKGPKGQQAHRDEGEVIRMPVLQPSKGTMVEPGIYGVQVDTIEETTSEFKGKQTAQLQFQFVILDEAGDRTDEEIRGWCSAKWHIKAKLYEWSRVLLGKRCPSSEEPFDSDKLLGRKMDVEVVPYKKGNGDDGTKINAVYPYRSMSKQADDEDDEKAS